MVVTIGAEVGGTVVGGTVVGTGHPLLIERHVLSIAHLRKFEK